MKDGTSNYSDVEHTDLKKRKLGLVGPFHASFVWLSSVAVPCIHRNSLVCLHVCTGTLYVFLHMNRYIVGITVDSDQTKSG